MSRCLLFIALTGVSISPSTAQTSAAGSATSLVNPDVGVPVFPYDITDRPYKILGEVKASVRKATAFSKSPSQAKIYRELWGRGQKLGADAVVNAKYGNAHVTAFSWGASSTTGTAIKFVTTDAAAKPAGPGK